MSRKTASPEMKQFSPPNRSNRLTSPARSQFLLIITGPKIVKLQARVWHLCLSLSLCLLLAAEVRCSQPANEGTVYQSGLVCQVIDKMNWGCMTLAPTSMSPTPSTPCAILCQIAPDECLAFLVETGTGRCYFMGPACQSVEPYSDGSCPDIGSFNFQAFFPNPCKNGGSLVAGHCRCTGGYIGGNCEFVAKSCEELADHGYARHTVHIVQLKINSKTVKTICEMDDDNFRIYISQSDGSGGFDKTYTEYEQGFYEHSGLFWLGLESMHYLNQQSLGFVVLSFVFEDGEARIAYDEFYLFSSNKWYEAGYQNCEIVHPYHDEDIECDTCLAGVGFSAPVGEGSSPNAAAAKTGWWIDDSSIPCNPNGLRYDEMPSAAHNDHVKMPHINFYNENPGRKFKWTRFYFQEPLVTSPHE